MAPGDKVFLKASRAEEPGTAICLHRGKVTVYWVGMDYWSRYGPEALGRSSAPQEPAIDNPTCSTKPALIKAGRTTVRQVSAKGK